MSFKQNNNTKNFFHNVRPKINYSQNNDFENNSNTDNFKNYLLEYLYDKIEVGEHKYIIVKNISDVYDLKSKKYYMSANSCGINSILIFMKKDDVYLSYLIDRRSISYNRQTLNKSQVRITKVNLAVDIKIYDGTILDGIMMDTESNIINSNVNNSTSPPKVNFMVTNILSLCGKSLITTDYKNKMYLGLFMLDKLISKNDKTNNIELHISRPFELNEIKTLFNDYIGNNIKNYNIKGIVFYPQFTGSKIIYIFDKEDEKYKFNLLEGKMEINKATDFNYEDENFDYSDKKRIFKFELVNPECIDDIVLNFEMVKTSTPDVYKLFSIFVNKKKKLEYIKKKIGYAYIPTYILSIKCKMYFLNRESIIMSCKFNTFKNKWIPIEEAENQKIDIINNEKRLKITEQIIETNDNEYIKKYSN